ncbi:hypothetical protein [Bradyrhizobium sp. USDA 4354]
MSADDADPAQHELRLGIAAGVNPIDGGQLDRRPVQRVPFGLVFKVFLGLARIESRLVRLLRECLWNSRENGPQQHQRGKKMPLLTTRSEPVSVV